MSNITATNYVVLSKFSTAKLCDEVAITPEYLGIQGTPLGDFMQEYMDCEKAHIIPTSVRKELAREVSRIRNELKKYAVTYWPSERIGSTLVFYLPEYFAIVKKLYDDFCIKYNDMLANIKKNQRAYIIEFLGKYSAVIAKLNNADKMRMYNALKAEVDIVMSTGKFGETNFSETKLACEMDANRIFLKKMANFSKAIVDAVRNALTVGKPFPVTDISDALNELKTYNNTVDNAKYEEIIRDVERIIANPNNAIVCDNACSDIEDCLQDINFVFQCEVLEVK